MKYLCVNAMAVYRKCGAQKAERPSIPIKLCLKKGATEDWQKIVIQRNQSHRETVFSERPGKTTPRDIFEFVFNKRHFHTVVVSHFHSESRQQRLIPIMPSTLSILQQCWWTSGRRADDGRRKISK